MVTICLQRYNKKVEVKLPAMYEELQLALWKLGLDRDPEKYSLIELEATFRYGAPFEYHLLQLLEGEMSLLEAVSIIFSVITAPRPILNKVQILLVGIRTASELRSEIDRLVEEAARYSSTCIYPISGLLMDAHGEIMDADEKLLSDNASLISDAIYRMQKWIIHDMPFCFADTETDAEESLFQKIVAAEWSVEVTGSKLYGRIKLLLTDDLTSEEERALSKKAKKISRQDIALRLERWSLLTEEGALYIYIDSGEVKVNSGKAISDTNIVIPKNTGNDDDEASTREPEYPPLEKITDDDWLNLLLEGDHMILRPSQLLAAEDWDA